MKTTLAVLLAAAALGVAVPASACDCFWRQLTDDTAPPFQPILSPSVQAQVALRDGRGLSQAGFYNDPSAYIGASYARRREETHVIDSPDVVRRRY
jgi:hypothetical protein